MVCQRSSSIFEAYSSFGEDYEEEDDFYFENGGGKNCLEKFKNWSHRHWTKLDDLLYALTKMGVILAYFYTCDRTNYFMKESK